jgi:hypothetical protein
MRLKNPLLGWFRHWTPQNAETAAEPSVREIRPISNADLTEADIPSEDAEWEWPGIPWFAASFNGYKHWGSSQKCFEIGDLARAKRLEDLSLTELRTSLFCQYRAICHNDGILMVSDLPQARATISEIRDRVRRRAID